MAAQLSDMRNGRARRFSPVGAEIHPEVADALHMGYDCPVERPTSVSHEVTEDGWVVLTFLARRDPPGRVPVLDGLPTGWPELEPVRVVGSLAVHYRRKDPDDPHSPLDTPDQVALYLPEGVTATAVRRFAWSRWLGVTDAVARHPSDSSWTQPGAEPPTPAGSLHRALFAELGYRVNLRGRPGRRGHPEDFYRDIADRYRQLTIRGVRNPTKTIAEERKYSRNTVAGWVRRARQLGYLPPARRGRAG